MSETVNLAPGTVVPKTGKYKCMFCGEGGVADLFAQVLGGSQLNTSKLRSVGRQSTVKFFEAGKTFPQCPTCGPATGWTLIEDAQPSPKKPAARHDESVAESGVCDVCGQKVFRPNGYLLTTREVVSTPGYWKHYYQHHKSELVGMGVSSFEAFCRNLDIRTGCTEAMARQSTAWMVCEKCIQIFAADRDQTRTYAMKWWESGRKYSPPGTGPAPLSSVNMGDGKAMFSSHDATAPRRATPKKKTKAAPQAKKKWWEVWK